MVIIGITGTIGAGKGEAVSYLESKGFRHFSVRAFLIEELKKRGLPVRRDTMTDLADQFRREHSPGYIIERLHKQACQIGGNSVIESVRALAEVDFFKKRGCFYLIAVDADLVTRYDRIVKRASELDHVTFEEFKAQNEREMASNDPTRGNIAGCMKLADFTIQNDGSLDNLHKKVDVILEKIAPDVKTCVIRDE
jgi:dephospho-CoA kinase